MGVTQRDKWVVVFAIVTVLAVFNDHNVVVATVAKKVKGGVKVFDVTDYGAKGDGKPVYDEAGESINGLGIMKAWIAACEYPKGPSKVLIPNGTYVVAQTHFSGPCKSNVVIDLQGIIEPNSDDSQFPNHVLLNFQDVDGVTLTGSGSIDAKNRGPPSSKDPNRDIFFFNLLPLITFYNSTNSIVDGINCKNPIAFHTLVVFSQNITIKNVRFDAEKLALESDTSGVYISGSNRVEISNSFIRTGDNCITIAPGSTNVHVDGVTCSSGQGISIGADPIDDNFLNVENVTVKNCTFSETTFGASVHPRTQANQSEISNILFQDLIMAKVKQPIAIHQQMPPRLNKSIQATVKDVYIKGIIGTSTSNFGVTISCNPKLPCDNIEILDIHLKHLGKFTPPRKAGLSGFSPPICPNHRVISEGEHDQLSCASFHY